MSEERQKLEKYLEKKKLQNNIDKLTQKYSGKKILAYGAGRVADIIIKNYDISGLDIIGFADSKYSQETPGFHGYKTLSPAEIKDLNPDVIIFFVLEPKWILEYFDFYYSELKDITKENLIPVSFWEKLTGIKV